MSGIKMDNRLRDGWMGYKCGKSHSSFRPSKLDEPPMLLVECHLLDAVVQGRDSMDSFPIRHNRLESIADLGFPYQRFESFRRVPPALECRRRLVGRKVGVAWQGKDSIGGMNDNTFFSFS